MDTIKTNWQAAVTKLDTDILRVWAANGCEEQSRLARAELADRRIPAPKRINLPSLFGSALRSPKANTAMRTKAVTALINRAAIMLSTSVGQIASRQLPKKYADMLAQSPGTIRDNKQITLLRDAVKALEVLCRQGSPDTKTTLAATPPAQKSANLRSKKAGIKAKSLTRTARRMGTGVSGVKRKAAAA